MIEKIVIDYLTERLGYPVYAEYPDEPQEKCVVIERTQTKQVNHICNSRIAVQCYETTMERAAELADEVNDIMMDIVGLESVTSCSLSSAYNHPDLQHKRYRYQNLYELYFY